jgi:hypothetical protein
MKRCWLRATVVRLLDEQEYTFRKLSFGSPVAVELLDVIEGDGSTADAMRAMVAAVEESLSFDQEPGVAGELLRSGALPLSLDGNGSEEEEEVTQAVFAAITGLSRKDAKGRGKKGASHPKG